ncbi:MAG TPA: heparan-alpha-glucosaminide N-acetyltransferase domain-containing protein [Acidimicrobiales bacterium]|nr:heparan-alpha-glucosaminide N-acetyltransferase domain-containing protein [Acidimicrobiales bacterium]
MPGLDRLRAVALMMMLVHHFVGWFGRVDAREVLPGWQGMAVTDIAAPAFAVAAGASSLLFMEARRRAGSPVLATVLRRYGMLIPIGFVLQSLITGAVWNWGVLQTLGASIVLSTACASLVVRSAPGAALLAGALFAAGHRVELVVADGHPWVADVFGSNFPLLTYVAFALVGVAAARAILTWPSCDRWAVVAGLGFVVVTVVWAGEPDRYPADASFVLPGLAGTLLLYGLLERWPVLDGVLRTAGRHTLGIFIGHYLARVVMGRLGWLDHSDPVPAVLLAVTATALAVVVAPLVPTLPWSPRTGWAPGFGPRRRQTVTA